MSWTQYSLILCLLLYIAGNTGQSGNATIWFHRLATCLLFLTGLGVIVKWFIRLVGI